MKDLLFLSHRIPYPPDKGEKIRAWHMFRRLAQTHRMHVGCFIDDPADRAHIPTLRAECEDLLCLDLNPTLNKLRAARQLAGNVPLSLDYFASARLRRWVDAKFAGGIDRVFVYCSAMAPYVMGKLPSASIHAVLDMVDVDSAKWSAYAEQTRGPARLVWSREARTLLAFERRAAATFDHTLLVSPDEAACFRILAPECSARVGWMQNGVDLDYFAPELAFTSPYPRDGRMLVFTGTMDYRPNVDAMLWFVREVMPLLRATSPVTLYIVGANPAAAIRKLAAADVVVTGRVGDIRPYVAHADAVIAPLRIARGIQNKVLEGMAMGRKVIASPQGFEGIDAVPGRDLLVADDAGTMAARIGAVLAGAHPGLGQAARQAMARAHGWDRTLEDLPSLFEPAGRDARRRA